MMDGMMGGMGWWMLVWGAVGVLVLVFLVLAILRLLKKP